MLIFVLFTKHYYWDEISEEKVGGTCCKHGLYEKLKQNFSLKT